MTVETVLNEIDWPEVSIVIHDDNELLVFEGEYSKGMDQAFISGINQEILERAVSDCTTEFKNGVFVVDIII